MTQPTHTPAPWIQDGVNVTIPSGEYRIAKCLMDTNGADHNQAEANARLIAAAPELLEALESAVKKSPFVPSPTGITVNFTFEQIKLMQ